jgi:hypothetical protein
VVHGSADPGLSTLSVGFDDAAPVVVDLAAQSLSPAVDVPAGTHHASISGVASVETGERPVVFTSDVELGPGAHPLLVVIGEPTSTPALAALLLDEDASGTSTRVRVVHGLVGVDAIDVCVGGAPLAAALAPGGVSSSAPASAGAASVELRATGATPCSGRSLGVAHVTLAEGRPTLLVLEGRAARRGRMTAHVIACTEGPDAACTTVATGAR